MPAGADRNDAVDLSERQAQQTVKAILKRDPQPFGKTALEGEYSQKLKDAIKAMHSEELRKNGRTHEYEVLRGQKWQEPEPEWMAVRIEEMGSRFAYWGKRSHTDKKERWLSFRPHTERFEMALQAAVMTC